MDVPVTGVVFNTRNYRNTEYQSSASSIGISWYGFQDAFSGIKNYYAAISHMPFANQSNNTTNTGLRTNYVFQNLALENGKTYYGLVKAVDNVGHVSTVAVSKGITIDTTPPVGYRCEKYSDIGQVSKVMSGIDETAVNLQYTSSLQKLYKITGNLLSIDDYQMKIKINIDRMHMYLPIVKDHNQGYNFEHSFSSQNTGLQNISLETDYQTNITVNMTLFECIQIIEDNNKTIELKQISRSMLAVQLLVKDEDSSLSKVELGAGTTVDGFQIKSLSNYYHFNNKHLIYANAPHGTRVYVTAIAENNAGLRSLFHSGPITIDHTSSVVNNLVGRLQNVQVNISGFLEIRTIVQATWDVIDEESGMKQCYCSIGNKPELFDIHSVWIAQSLTSCESSEIQLSHGQHIYLNLKCVNNIKLSTIIFTEPLVASIEKPDTYSAVLAFGPQNEESSEYMSRIGSHFPVQSNHTCLELKWVGFEDLSGIDYYEYRLTQSGQAFFTDWTKTYRNFVQVADIDMESGEITAEVRAINTGSFISESVNASHLVARHAPKLTGLTTTITRRGNSLTVNWADVFQIFEGVPLSYSLVIGSRRGYTDILDMNYITSTKYDVYIPDSTIITSNIKEVIVRIVCIYGTGLRTIYDTSYKM
ncbi:uncharacterized protein LOC128553173 [Mercenaria mercenaria]|uniref:uncharacterized protein LOC128553173 n=1 Tax=Mercenaria mercenaria TaxID=6596 RepID=UPI00234E3E9D|nr:uncharacterized protein LOC128553173 [Mercenaria mercenaria]